MSEYDQHPFNCPNCGRFMLFNSAKGEFTCKCKGIWNLKEPHKITIISKTKPKKLTLWET